MRKSLEFQSLQNATAFFNTFDDATLTKSGDLYVVTCTDISEEDWYDQLSAQQQAEIDARDAFNDRLEMYRREY